MTPVSWSDSDRQGIRVDAGRPRLGGMPSRARPLRGRGATVQPGNYRPLVRALQERRLSKSMSDLHLLHRRRARDPVYGKDGVEIVVRLILRI